MLFGVLIRLLLAVTPRLCSAIAELQDEVEALEANIGSRVKIGALTDGIESRGVVFCVLPALNWMETPSLCGHTPSA